MVGGGPELNEDTPPSVRVSVPDLFARLIGDARVWIKAELALLKCRSETLVGALRTAVVLILLAVTLVVVALFAAAIGAILALATIVGPVWATLIVVLVLLVAAAVFGWLGAARIKRAIKDQS